MQTNSSSRLDASGLGPEAPALLGTAIDVVSVSTHTATRRVLAGVSLSVASGELVALVGGSGAGKTTLLETMAGLRPVAEGAVFYDGVPV